MAAGPSVCRELISRLIFVQTFASTPLLWRLAYLFQAMGFYFRPYAGRSQQDAHEFLGDLLNTLHEELCPYGRKIYRNMLGARQKGSSTALSASEGKKNSSSSSSIMSFFQSPSADR